MENIETLLLEKFDRLKKNLKDLGKIVIAYSGGVDSTFLLACANEAIPNKFLAVTAKGPIFPEWETKMAINFLKDHGFNHKIINYNPLNNNDFIINSPMRCFFCKKSLFSRITDIAKENGYSAIVDGTNADDIKDYRPGLRALKELHITSPLKEAGLGKNEIRKLSRVYYNLQTSELPSMACLATRIPYGEHITLERLKKIEKIEMLLHNFGFSNFRARLHGNILRIEVPPEDFGKILDGKISKSIIELSKKLGFLYTTVDLEGYRSGSLNEGLK